jgi:hypothetical protein
MFYEEPPTVPVKSKPVTLPSEMVDDIAIVSLKWHYNEAKEELNELVKKGKLGLVVHQVMRLEQFKGILNYYGVEA